jgi:hypothetical protein
MSYPPFTKHSYTKPITIAAGVVILLGLVGFGTVQLLTKLNVKSLPLVKQLTGTSQQTVKTPTDLKSSADQEVIKGDLQGALRDYKAALQGAQAAGDIPAAKDIETQITIVEKTIANNATGKTKPANLGLAK